MDRGSPNPWLNALLCCAVATGLVAAVLPGPGDEALHMPKEAPYVAAEAQVYPPPYEELWREAHNPGRCQTCHGRIFEQWNGSMMSSSWRDPAWRAAFLLLARATSTAGDCDTPAPPDGTARARLNPFAGDGCTSTFETAAGPVTTARPGSLLDGFCSQCHMPTNYVDNFGLAGVQADPASGLEAAWIDPKFHPTSDNGTGIAYATLEEQFRNTDTGKQGIFCGVCHTMADTRDMPFANYRRSGAAYRPVPGTGSRAKLRPPGDRMDVPDPGSPTLGYAVGAGAFRLSPHAIGRPGYLGPLRSAGAEGEIDLYLSSVFGIEVPYQQGRIAGHEGYYQPLHERAEMCGACHDVTNPLPIKNTFGLWAGGFPIERTYTEWRTSRYADRPDNPNFDPAVKRDCQTCHMQQDYGQPGTAQTLYRDGRPVAPLTGSPCNDGPQRPVFFSHHFIGGNAYIPRLIGADVDALGSTQAYPELSTFSFSSADKESPYSNAYWMNASASGARTQHARLAWDRLRNVLDLALEVPAEAAAGARAPLHIALTNSGSGHNFPSGFPEGRVAWVAVRAFDLASGRELAIHDAHWRRTSRGVGGLTTEESPDPSFPRCKSWKLPAGSPDPYAVLLKAVASLGDGCPTLDLPFATPLNLEVDEDGIPTDAEGRRLGPDNRRGLPRFRDLDGDGDLFDDSFLADTRLRPLPHPGATLALDRYSVVLPPGTRGPVAVTAAVYYQSLEAAVAKKFLGNLADLDTDHHLEPCVLGGGCDGRTPTVEPAVVEGAPPVPMEVRTRVIAVRGAAPDRTPPAARTYPEDGAVEVYRDVVVKAFFSEPVTGMDAVTFTLTDEAGVSVPAFVDQIGDGAWALFPHQVFLEPGQTYTARLAGACDLAGNCAEEGKAWSFTVAAEGEGRGDTSVPLGFPAAGPAGDPAPRLAAARLVEGKLVLAFSEPVVNVTDLTVQVHRGGCARPGPTLPGRLASNPRGDRWTFLPGEPVGAREGYCLAVSGEVFDLAGQGLAGPYRRVLR